MKGLSKIIALAIILSMFSGCSLIKRQVKDAANAIKEQNEISALIDKEEYDKAFEKIKVVLSKKYYSPVEFNQIAYKLLENGRDEEGLYVLNILVEKNRRFDAALNNISWAYEQSGNYNMADYYADKALSIIPNEDVEYVNKGNAQRGLKKYDEATKYYEKALKNNPKCTYAVWGKALVLYNKKDYKGSLELFREYAQMNPNDEKSTEYYITTCYSNLKQYDEAIKEYEKQLKSKPDDTSPLYSIANIYIQKNKDYTKALEYYEKIIAIDKEDAWAYLGKASCLAVMDKKAEACENIKKSIELDSECLYEISSYDEFERLKNFRGFKQIFE